MGMSLIYSCSKWCYNEKKAKKQAKPAEKTNSEYRQKLKMTLLSPKTVKVDPIQLLFPQGPDGSSISFDLKMAEKHLCWLCNLFHSLHKAENTQNRPKKRAKWFPVAKVMPKTNSVLFSPKNSTKIGVAGVSIAKNSKSRQIRQTPPKTRRTFSIQIYC
jgi:hypothetical protein